MHDTAKVLTGAWAVTDVSAYDILIKATIRAATIITNFIHLQPGECNLLAQYVNWVENTSWVAAVTAGMEISESRGGANTRGHGCD